MFLGLADPDPDTVIQRYGSRSGSGPFYQQAKIVRKTLIPRYCFVTFLDFLSWKNNETMYLQKVISRKTI
jgi:hypothetical protein